MTLSPTSTLPWAIFARRTISNKNTSFAVLRRSFSLAHHPLATAYLRHSVIILLLIAIFLHFPSTLRAQSDITPGSIAMRVDMEIKSALTELEMKASSVLPDEREQLRQDVITAFSADIRPLRAAFDRAKSIFAQRYGAGTAIRSTAESIKCAFFNCDPTILTDAIAASLSLAGVKDELENTRERMDQSVEHLTIDLYDWYRRRAVMILKSLIERRDFPQRTLDAMEKELLEQVLQERLALAQARNEPVIETKMDVPIGTLAGGAALVATRQVIRGQLSRQIGARFGTSIVARALGKKVAQILIPGIGWAMAIGGVIYDILNLESNMQDNAAKAIDGAYNGIRDDILAPSGIEQLLTTIVSTVNEMITKDNEAIHAALSGRFEAVLHQAASPGAKELLGEFSPDEVYDVLKNISVGFGSSFQDVPLPTKYLIVNKLGPVRTGRLVDLYGETFITLANRYPGPILNIAALDDGDKLIGTIIGSDDVGKEIEILDRASKRYPNFDGAVARSFLIIRKLLPNYPPSDITALALESISSVEDVFSKLVSAYPQVAARLTEAILQANVSRVSLETLENIQKLPDIAALSEIMIHIGGEKYISLWNAYGSDVLIRFVESFPNNMWAQLLTENKNYLVIFAESPQGKRAVELRHRLVSEYGGLTEDQDRTLVWVASYVSLEPSSVTVPLLDDLIALGIPVGPWPSFLAVPVARATAAFGLTTVIIGLVFLIVLPPLLAWWRFFGRIGRHSLLSAASREVRTQPPRGSESAVVVEDVSSKHSPPTITQQ